MATITFHSMAASGYLRAAQQLADEKGVTYDVNEFVVGSPEHPRLHPFGKMPLHGDVVLYETLAIAHFIDRAFDGPALQPFGFDPDVAFLKGAQEPLRLQMRLIDEGGYLVGDALTLADCFLLPHRLFVGRTPARRCFWTRPTPRPGYRA